MGLLVIAGSISQMVRPGVRVTPLLQAFAVLGIVWVAYLAPPAWAVPNQESAEYLEEARQSLAVNDLRTAVVLLKNAVRADPGNVEARFELGRVHLRLGDMASAQKELTAARRGGMRGGEINALLGRIMLLQGRPADVLKEIDVSAASTPKGQAQLYAIRSDAYRFTGDVDAALAEARSAVDADPDSAEPWMSMALANLAANNIAEAAEAATRATQLAPREARPFAVMAEVHIRAGKPAEAVEAINRAVENEPGNLNVRDARAVALMAAGRLDDAEGDIEYALARQNDRPSTLYLKALLLARRGSERYPEALDVLGRIPGIEAFPPAAYMMGALNFAAGNNELALEHAQNFIGANPDDPVGKILRSAIQIQMGRPEDAIPTLEALEKELPDNYAVISMLASAKFAIRDYEEAAVYFERAQKLDAENEDIRLNLIQSRLGSGRTDEAIEDLEDLIASDEASPEIYVLLTLAQIRADRLEGAEETARRLKDERPDTPLADNMLASIAIARGDLEDGRRHLQNALETEPDFLPAILNLARLDVVQGDLDAADARYQRALELRPGNTEVLLSRAEIALRRQDFAGALRILEDAAEADPDDVRPDVARVNVLLETGESERALVVAREALDAAPDSPAAISAMARAQLAVGETGSAATNYRRLALRFPESPAVQFSLGRALAAADNLPGAAEALDRAIELDPDFIDARRARVRVEGLMNGGDAAIAVAKRQADGVDVPRYKTLLRADGLVAAGKHGEAASAYASAFAEEPDRDTLRRLYGAKLRAGDREGSQQAITDWLAEHPNDTALRFAYASQLIGNREYDRAIDQLEQIIQRQPEAPSVLNNLAWLYDRKGDSARATELAEKAHALAPEAPLIADTLGWILFRNGDENRARRLLKVASDAMPEHPEIAYHYAVALEKAGQRDRAIEVFERAEVAKAQFPDREDALELRSRLMAQ